MRSGWVCVRNVLETPIFSQIYDTYRTVKAGWAHTNSGCEWNSVGDPNSRIHSSAGAHAEMRVRSAEDDVGSEAGAHPIIYMIVYCLAMHARYSARESESRRHGLRLAGAARNRLESSGLRCGCNAGAQAKPHRRQQPYSSGDKGLQ